MDKDEILKRAAEAAEMANSGGQPQAAVQPQPVPSSWSVGQGHMPDGSLCVVLVVHTPVGQNVFFVDAESAKGLADGMLRAAQASSSGLVVPQ